VAGAEVRIEPRSLTIEDLKNALGWRSRTTVDGRFRLSGLHPGVLYRLIASQARFAPTLAFVQSGPHPLRLVLSPGRTAAGRVVDAAGRPVAGARVELRRSLPGESYLGQQGPLDDGLYPARTDQDGRFVLPHLAFRHADLTVHAAGFLPFEAPALHLPPPPGTADLGTFTLVHGERVEGRVTDPAGHPLAGIQVWQEIGDLKLLRDNSASYLAAGPAAVTGLDGGFALAGEPRGGSLLVCREGYLPESVEWQGPPAGPLALVLHPAGRIEGRVVTPGGAPVAEAHVGVVVAGQGHSDCFGPPGPCATSPEGSSTDREGRFTLAPLYPGWYEVSARAAGFLAPPSAHRVQVAEGAAVSGIEIRLDRGASVSGRVRTPAGAPAAGARMSVWGERSYAEAVTDGEGRYLLTGVQPGTREVKAEEAETVPDPGDVESALMVGPGENHLDLTLARTARHEVHGRVVGPAGAPVAGARLQLGHQIGTEHPDALAAEDGSFTLRLGNGAHCLSAAREGLAGGSVAFVVRDADVSDLSIRLLPGCVVTGRVLGLTADERAEVQVAAHQGGMDFDHLAYVDRDGGYRIEDLAPGEWTLTVFSGPTPVSGSVTLSPGSVATLDLALAGRFAVRGEVTDPDGEPIAGGEVTLLGSGSFVDRTVTRKDGSFALRAESGTYTLSTWASGFQSDGSRPVEVAGAPVDGLAIVLRPGTTLHGRVLGLAPGDPFQVEGRRGDDRWTRSGNDGTYSVEGLAPGEWQVTASLAERPLLSTHQVTRRITVPAGPAEVSLDFTLPLGNLTLTSRLSRPLGPGMEVRLRSPSDPDLAVRPQFEGGVLRFGRLLPGPYQLRVEGPQGQMLAERQIDLAADAEVEIEVPEKSQP